MNNISGSISGLTTFTIQSIFATMECKVSDSSLSIVGEFSLILCKTCFAGDYTVAYRSSLNNAIDYSM